MNEQYFDKWLLTSRALFDSSLRFQELAQDAVLKGAQLQLSASRELLDFGNTQFKLVSESRDPSAWLSEGGKNAADFSQKVVDRSGELLRLSREAQVSAASWASETAKTVNETLKS